VDIPAVQILIIVIITIGKHWVPVQVHYCLDADDNN